MSAAADDISKFMSHGRYANGQKYVRIAHSSRGVTATIEGIGETDDEAVEDLYYRMRALASWAEEAVDAMTVDKPE